MWAEHLGEPVVKRVAGTKVELVLIPPGQFLMGSSVFDPNADSDEKPQHEVQLTRPFFLQTSEVTQGQWTSVMGTRPWKGRIYTEEGDEYAASCVSWYDALEYCNKLSTADNVSPWYVLTSVERDNEDSIENAVVRIRGGTGYHLPTEAQWEYACRAGVVTRYCFGDDEGKLDAFAWYDANALNIGENHAHKVKQKSPNAFGLYDMHGNVCEWCQDGYDEGYYQQFASHTAVDPQCPSLGLSFRVNRGGSWFGDAGLCRAAYRSRNSPDYRYSYLGFRVAQVPSSR